MSAMILVFFITWIIVIKNLPEKAPNDFRWKRKRQKKKKEKEQPKNPWDTDFRESSILTNRFNAIRDDKSQ